MPSSMSLRGASSSLSSSSSSVRPWTHDVFLSFRESRWCLDELLKILECKETKKQIILPLFYDVDPSEVRHQKGSFGEAFTKLRYKFKDEVKVTKWEAALEKVANLSGLELGDRNESEFVQDIIKWVDSIMVNRTVLNVAKYPVGMESRVRDIYQHLSMGRNDIICMVGIFGTGGIGKTTISKEIYNIISYQFEGSCFLKNIRETSKAGGLIQLQKTLLYEISGISLECHDTDKGINVIRHRICSKRVLLILDDVDELVQLETLAGARDWFGSGSKIIITTRDQHLLNIFKVDSKYEVKRLDHNEALELFSWHAFEEDKPIEDYVELSKQVIQYAEGLPLALTMLGSDLRGQSISQWRSTLDKYKQIPSKNIQEVLCISYDGLDDNEKEIFLDIAFFFNGQCLGHVVKILDSCGFSPDNAIKRLIDKCLITITTYNTLWMHDLLQDMGREIVRKESRKQLGTRSRLWFFEDVRYVLEENAGTNNVEGIKVDLPQGHDHDMIRLNPKAFAKMKRLRFFISRDARFSGRVLNYLSNELRVLDWSNCPLQSLPSNFHGGKLIDFKLYRGRIKEISGQFKNLMVMEFSECKFLTKIPDLSSCSNLKKLNIMDCENLVEVHDSVGFLDKLACLNLYQCSNLKSFPRCLKLRSLEVLNLQINCSKCQNFSEIEGKMERLCCIFLLSIARNEIPSSIGYFTQPMLKSLYVRQCSKLMRFPNSIHLLENLEELCLINCINLEIGEVASSVNGCFTGIEELSIEGCMNLMRLPISVSHLQHLKSLSLDNYPNLAREEICSSIGHLTGLKKLHLTTSRLFKRSEPESSAELLPSPVYNCYLDSFSFYCSLTLQELDLSKSAIVSLPPSIKRFVELRILSLWHCEKLQEILHLPPNIQKLYASECFSLERFPEVSRKFQFYRCGLRELRWIDLSGCHKLLANIGSQVPNPSFVEEHIQDHSCGIIFPGNKIPDWFSHTKETSNGDDSCELDISGPLYLDEIIGISFCAVLGADPDHLIRSGIGVYINGNMLVEADFYLLRDSDHVYLNYSFPECIEQWLRYPNGDNLRFSFYSEDKSAIFKNCGVRIIYKHEENENLTTGECSIDSLNGIQLYKRSRDHGDNNFVRRRGRGRRQ
ncbi:disease resistance protein RPV1-like isoform X2 [Juglans microcarpa x Juglans regia]|uniref:disease resistance protein RPV1-like isoform X2 n=1 Tax=Juglans microcarpa x Juglans regia TaxID=2249226 RepID=UPI001B7DAF19|nr:disease resistance protein RPV1-like isoform X2 [Juglans microcarpa x Juglans regia]